jgi:hypothetical protein
MTASEAAAGIATGTTLSAGGWNDLTAAVSAGWISPGSKPERAPDLRLISAPVKPLALANLAALMLFTAFDAEIEFIIKAEASQFETVNIRLIELNAVNAAKNIKTKKTPPERSKLRPRLIILVPPDAFPPFIILLFITFAVFNNIRIS